MCGEGIDTLTPISNWSNGSYKASIVEFKVFVVHIFSAILNLIERKVGKLKDIVNPKRRLSVIACLGIVVEVTLPIAFKLLLSRACVVD